MRHAEWVATGAVGATGGDVMPTELGPFVVGMVVFLAVLAVVWWWTAGMDPLSTFWEIWDAILKSRRDKLGD